MVSAVDPARMRMNAIKRSACPTCGSCSGMFTANSMNCLTEALGLSLPGNGSLLATHADRKELFLQAGRLVVDLAKRYYEQDDASVLPRNIATFEAFENAMSLDIAMGGSTNTVLHLLAAAHEAEVDFTMADIDRLSRKVPNLCKVAPSTQLYHMEDVHRAGGVIAILGELAGRSAAPGRRLRTPGFSGAAIADWDIAVSPQEAAKTRYLPGPAAFPPSRRSANPPAGPISIWIGPLAASEIWNTPTAGTEGWRCCTATWRWRVYRQNRGCG